MAPTVKEIVRTTLRTRCRIGKISLTDQQIEWLVREWSTESLGMDRGMSIDFMERKIANLERT